MELKKLNYGIVGCWSFLSFSWSYEFLHGSTDKDFPKYLKCLDPISETQNREIPDAFIFDLSILQRNNIFCYKNSGNSSQNFSLTNKKC